MNKKHEPIDFVFFDSGTGALPYMLYLKKQSPSARCICLADTANFPYGEKSAAEIIKAASSGMRLVLSRFSPGAIIIGCNTISVTALEALRTEFPSIPFVGTVPAIKQGAVLSKNRRIGLLATNKTINETYTADLAARFASDCTLVKRGDPDLVDFVEHSFFSASKSETFVAVQNAVDFFTEQNVDTIILGCTHFLHLKPYLEQSCAFGVQLVDSCAGVVNQALRVSKHAVSQGVLDDTHISTPDLSFFITGPKGKDENPYRFIANKLKIPYGGVLD